MLVGGDAYGRADPTVDEAAELLAPSRWPSLVEEQRLERPVHPLDDLIERVAADAEPVPVDVPERDALAAQAEPDLRRDPGGEGARATGSEGEADVGLLGQSLDSEGNGLHHGRGGVRDAAQMFRQPLEVLAHGIQADVPEQRFGVREVSVHRLSCDLEPASDVDDRRCGPSIVDAPTRRGRGSDGWRPHRWPEGPRPSRESASA